MYLTEYPYSYGGGICPNDLERTRPVFVNPHLVQYVSPHDDGFTVVTFGPSSEYGTNTLHVREPFDTVAAMLRDARLTVFAVTTPHDC